MANSVGFFIHDVLCEIRGICVRRGEDVGGDLVMWGIVINFVIVIKST